MSDDDLTWAVEASATQIALRWIVYQWKPAVDGSSKPLDLQIVHFSAQALSEMCAAYPILRNGDGRTPVADLFQRSDRRKYAPARSNVKRHRCHQETAVLSDRGNISQLGCETKGCCSIRNRPHSASGCFSGH
jgi:hypothetical protein